jgi:hypothetical protein
MSDFGRLIGVHVRREFEDEVLLRSPGRGEEVVHHRYGTPMMLDHPGQKESVKGIAPGRLEFRKLFLGEHAGHEHVMHHPAMIHPHVRGVRRRDLGPPVPKPLPHEFDLIALRHRHPLREHADFAPPTPIRNEGRHPERLCMMRNHPLHEMNVRLTVPRSLHRHPHRTEKGGELGFSHGTGPRSRRRHAPRVHPGRTRTPSEHENEDERENGDEREHCPRGANGSRANGSREGNHHEHLGHGGNSSGRTGWTGGTDTASAREPQGTPAPGGLWRHSPARPMISVPHCPGRGPGGAPEVISGDPSCRVSTSRREGASPVIDLRSGGDGARPRFFRGMVLWASALLVVGGVGSALAQGFRPDRPQECAPWKAAGPPAEFHFTRGIYSPAGGGGMGGFFGGGGFGRGARAWCTDHPKAEEQFLEVLTRLTGVRAHGYGNAIRLDDPDLRRFPILYMLEVGYMGMTNAEVEGLRSYLLAGGTLIIDDFWGTREWQNFEREINRVLPEYPIVELPMDHPVYRAYYQVDTIYQVPAIRANGNYSRTWEQDGYEARNFGIFDDKGRLLVAINWNTDLGDAWEWMEQPSYPLRFSTYAYQVGVNYIIHAMSR